MRYEEGKGFVIESQDEQFFRRHEERERLFKPASTPERPAPSERWDQACAVPYPDAHGRAAVHAYNSVVRTFDTGANRDVDHDKLDYEGFLSPEVLERFAQYMHKNRFLRDGSIRDSDNWQKGIPIPVYMKSMWRHFLSVWKNHRMLMRLQANEKVDPADLWQVQAQLEEDLSALLFNVQGMLHELLKK